MEPEIRYAHTADRVNIARRALGSATPATFKDSGDQKLKGIADPRRVYAVQPGVGR